MRFPIFRRTVQRRQRSGGRPKRIGGGIGMLRKMFEHYRMLRFESYGRWQSAKATIKFFCDWYLRDWYTRIGR
jgi:hypothetical protein